MRILVADDSKTMLGVVAASLTKMGHSVTAVSSGLEAIASYQKEKPDLIILDVIMDEMGGFECAKQIRALDPDDWIPIIFLSATVDDESIANGIDAGGDDYLTKPFSEITLDAKIRAMQRISDMRQKLFETTQKLYLQSSTDALTGIYNRFQFDRSIKDILHSADRFGHHIALLFIDLDNFKNINDSFGHKVGDELLVTVANRVRSCLKINDFISRIGGDEFAVILTDIERIEHAGATAQSIIDSLKKMHEISGHELRVGASIGIAFYPQIGTTTKNIVQNADIAMYHAKSLGRNNFQYYTEELFEKYKQQMNLEHSLKFCLDREELFLKYQPIIDVKTMRMVGLEALVCWNHPTFGLVTPNVFIPIAEEAGMMTAIGNWVFKKACEQAKKWNLKEADHFKLLINLSSRQILQENFIDFIKDTLEETGVPPELLELELTESTMMTYSGPFKDIITKLTEMKISISIDDFGTGYSSLIRLKSLPISTFKIDKFFIQDAVLDENSAIIVTCLIALGKKLGLNVIAEGVETKEQLEFLKVNECPEAQGFFISQPLRAENMDKYIEKIKNHEPFFE